MSRNEEAWEESICIWVSSGVYRGGTWLMEIADGKLRATNCSFERAKENQGEFCGREVCGGHIT